MPTEIANFLSRNFRAPRPADVEADQYTNALNRSRVQMAQNDVARIPQQNQAQDLAIRGAEQQVNSAGRENAAGIASNIFAAIEQNPSMAGQLVGSREFQESMRALGHDPAQFTVTPQDTPESLAQSARTWRTAVAGNGSELPVGARNFDIMAREAGASPEDRSRAARIDLGLEPRAVDMRERNPPSGYEWAPDGSLKATPGGPADPAGPNLRRNSTALRKEYEDQKAVSDYRLVLPVYQRAATAEDTRAGDISIIYALGKIFDPGSVVREGELQLSMQAAPWLQQITSNINSQITGQGRLNPELRAELVRAMEGQVDSLRMPYTQERERYGRYATDFGFTPDSVIGPDPADAFPQRNGGSTGGAAAPEGTVISNGSQTLVKRNGQWVPQ